MECFSHVDSRSRLTGTHGGKHGDKQSANAEAKEVAPAEAYLQATHGGKMNAGAGTEANLEKEIVIETDRPRDPSGLRPR